MIKYIFVKEFYKKSNKNYVYTFYYHHRQCRYQRLQMPLVLSATTRNLGLQLLSGHFADTFDELKLDFAFIIKYIVTPTTQITINNRFSEFIFIYHKII